MENVYDPTLPCSTPKTLSSKRSLVFHYFITYYFSLLHRSFDKTNSSIIQWSHYNSSIVALWFSIYQRVGFKMTFPSLCNLEIINKKGDHQKPMGDQFILVARRYYFLHYVQVFSYPPSQLISRVNCFLPCQSEEFLKSSFPWEMCLW